MADIPEEAQKILDKKEERKSPEKTMVENLSLLEQARIEREKLETATENIRKELEKLEKLKADAIIAGRGQAGYQPAQKSSKEIADENAKEILGRLRNYK